MRHAESAREAVPALAMPKMVTINTAPLSQPNRLRDGVQLRLVLPTGQAIPLDRELAIGQAPGNEVVLHDDRVSRRHCRIAVADGRVRIIDLNSTNGTWVDNLRVAEADLNSGSVVSVGRLRMRVHAVNDRDSDESAGLIGNSEAMRHARTKAARLARTDMPVLVYGETGTGKELMARLIHKESGRTGAFIAVNCGSIPRDLVESELFGHERGAFTGAAGRREGVFAEARGGTLFLDEIGDLPLEQQARLLRVLETKTVRPVGANREVAVDVRIVAATHVNLRAAVAEGKFREDLYYRLAVSVVETLPLRLRIDDVPALAEHILAREAGACRLTKEATEALCSHSWPGNVRELINVLKNAAALGGPFLKPSDLQFQSASAKSEGALPDSAVRTDGRSFVEIEKEVLHKALLRNGGNRRAAANELQMPKSTLCDKAKRYGLDEI